MNFAKYTIQSVAARNGARQARLAAFLKTVEVHPLDDGKAVGLLLALAATRDVVDAHLVILAVRLRVSILTGDDADLNLLADSLPKNRPTIQLWP